MDQNVRVYAITGLQCNYSGWALSSGATKTLAVRLPKRCIIRRLRSSCGYLPYISENRVFDTWSTRGAASVDNSIGAVPRETSLTCRSSNFSLHDNASDKTWDFYGLYWTHSLNSEKHVSHIILVWWVYSGPRWLVIRVKYKKSGDWCKGTRWVPLLSWHWPSSPMIPLGQGHLNRIRTSWPIPCQRPTLWVVLNLGRLHAGHFEKSPVAIHVSLCYLPV